MGRIEIRLGPKADWDEVRLRVRNLFGIANFAKAGRTRVDLEAIATAILDALGDQQTSSFRVSVRRADKQFPLTSPQIEREVGGRIKLARGWRVNLSEPELTISRRDHTGRGVLLLRQGTSPGGIADRLEWSGALPPLRWHRFARCRVSAHEARLPSAVSPLSQLPDRFPHIAGKDAGDCWVAHEASA